MLDELMATLWADYAALNPQAGAIHELLEDRGEVVVNDHIALRTFDRSPVGLEAVAAAFVAGGYREAGQYRFEAKKLRAKYYEHPHPERTKVFVSELQVDELASDAVAIIDRLVSEVPSDAVVGTDFPASGRPWRVSIADYELLAAHSEYAAWLAAFGFRANHFTVLVNQLTTFSSLSELNQFLIDSGFALNDHGGLIKGSPELLLEQSSTLAAAVTVAFSDGELEVPGCYYEFARRYPRADGQLYSGFVTESADRLFESTDRR